MGFARVVCIEGPIAAGKSSLLLELEARGFAVFPEPVEVWEPWLAAFYSRNTPPEGLVLGLQLRVLMSLHAIHDAIRTRPSFPHGVVFVERSPVACRDVFGPVTGLLPREAELFDEVYRACRWLPTEHVYLRVPWAVCDTRRVARGRGSETGVGCSLEYMRLVHDAHEARFRGSAMTIDTDGTDSPKELVDRVLASLQITV